MSIQVDEKDLDPGTPTAPPLEMGDWPEYLTHSADEDGYPKIDLPEGLGIFEVPKGFQGRLTISWTSEALLVVITDTRIHLVLQPSVDSRFQLRLADSDRERVIGFSYGGGGLLTPMRSGELAGRVELIRFDLDGHQVIADLGWSVFAQPTCWLVAVNGRIILEPVSDDLPAGIGGSDGIGFTSTPPLSTNTTLLVGGAVIDGREAGQGYKLSYVRVGFGSSALLGTHCADLVLLPHATYGSPEHCYVESVRGHPGSVIQIWQNHIHTVQSIDPNDRMRLLVGPPTQLEDDVEIGDRDRSGRAGRVDSLSAVDVVLKSASGLRTNSIERCSVRAEAGRSAPDLYISDGGRADAVEFVTGRVDHHEEAGGHAHVVLWPGRRSVLFGLTGSVRLAEAEKSVLVGGVDGLEICSIERVDGASPDFAGARIEGITIPLSGVDAPFITSALRSASIVNLNPPKVNGRVSIWRRGYAAFVHVARPRNSVVQDLRRSTSLHLLADVVAEKSSLGATRATYRYLALADRQESAASALERTVLFVLRLVGFGWRPARAALVWVVIAASIAIIAGIDQGLSPSVDGVANAGAVFLRSALSPLGLLPGSGSPNLLGEDINSDLGLTLARIAVALPFSSLLFAISRLARV